MADVILDQKSDQEIWDLYGGKWQKSALIDGGYEAEVFFPNLGNDGRWCWFTAAPIKAADGTLKICNVKERVLSIFYISQLENIFDVFETRDEALAALSDK